MGFCLLTCPFVCKCVHVGTSPLPQPSSVISAKVVDVLDQASSQNCLKMATNIAEFRKMSPPKCHYEPTVLVHLGLENTRMALSYTIPI